jgi:hypothetical protein
MKGILLDTEYHLMLRPQLNADGKIGSGLVVGDNTDQCAALVLEMSQGELKEDPLLGAGLTKFIRGKFSSSDVDQRIRQHLTRAGINYNEYKNRLITSVNK